VTRRLRGAIIFIIGALALGTMSACATTAEPDKVGLWYSKGPSDGDHFDHCITPGSVAGVAVNDYMVWVPDNVRTWNITSEPGGDSSVPLKVTAKPEDGQQSGLEVLVWVQTNLKLNTDCGSNDKDPNSPLVNWWENLGRRYNADTEEGWLRMIQNTVVPALEKAKNVMRNYTADQLVLGTVWAEAEPQFADIFSSELMRLSGGDYFCGPDFSRTDPDGNLWPNGAPCSSVAVSIKDVDYADPGIQAARNEKQKATEEAAAALIRANGEAAAKAAEAEGNKAAAAALRELYNNPAWVALQLAQLQVDTANACREAANCQIIMGDLGNSSVMLGNPSSAR
jgi:hypothetical protein